MNTHAPVESAADRYDAAIQAGSLARSTPRGVRRSWAGRDVQADAVVGGGQPAALLVDDVPGGA